MTSAHHLTVALAHHQYLKEQLRVQFPDAEDDVIADTLEGISSLDDALIHVMRSTETDAMLVAGINERIGELQARRERLAHRIDTKRNVVCAVMDRANLKKIEAPDFTLSLRNTPRVVVISDETLIPADYMRTPEPPAPTPDKKKIGDALKAENAPEIPGASLSNGGVGLTVRKK